MLIFNQLMELLTKGFQFFGNSNWAFLILSFVSLFFILKLRKIKNIKFNIFDTIFFIFTIFFFISLFLRQAPFGFIEYSTLFAGYFLFKYFQLKPIKFSKSSLYFLGLINFLVITQFYFSNFNRLFGLTNFNQSLTTYPNLWALITGSWLVYNFQSKRYFLTFLTSISFFLTLSKTSFISFFIVIFALFFISLKEKKLSIYFRNFSILAIGIFISFNILNLKDSTEFLNQRLTNQSISSQNSFKQRFIYFQQSLNMFQDLPLFGVGPNNFKALQPKYASEFYALSDHPHNIELKILSENGIFAFLTFALFILFYLLLNHKNLANPSFLTLIFILGQSQFDFNLNFSVSIILIAYLLANSIKLRSKDFKFSKIFFNFLLIQFIIITLISAVDLSKSKINNTEFFFLGMTSIKQKQSKYENYWRFNPQKVQELSPFDNLELHLDFSNSDKTNLKQLLDQVIKKTKINYNFLVSSDEIPYALKLACFHGLNQEFEDLKLAYTIELGQLDLLKAKEKYENFNCN